VLEGLRGTVLSIKDALLAQSVVGPSGCGAGLQLRKVANGLALLFLLHPFELLL